MHQENHVLSESMDQTGSDDIIMFLKGALTDFKALPV